MNTKIKSTAIAVAVAGLFAAQSAVADTLTFGGFSDGAISATIYNTPSPVGGNPTYLPNDVGGFNMTNGNTTFRAWCVDIFSWLATSASYNNVSGASFYGTGSNKVTDLQNLATRYLPSVINNATNSGAFQLAVWEIVNETSSTYNITGGNFYATSLDSHGISYGTSSAAAINMANTMLGNLNSPTNNVGQVLSVWQNAPGYTTQDLAVFAPVPEPQTYAMMLSGLGLIGFVARRRKQEQEYA